jgi:predicted amidohydrolase YtcJ
MYWAEDRLGSKRIKHAYAYKKLLDQVGVLPLGTDFPVEKVNPMLTFYAAVSRQDVNAYPEGGFQPQNALSREETLRGMTIWAAYSNFEEQEKGSLEEGKFADFIVLDEDLMDIEIRKVPDLKVIETYISGERVYQK